MSHIVSLMQLSSLADTNIVLIGDRRAQRQLLTIDVYATETTAINGIDTFIGKPVAAEKNT